MQLVKDNKGYPEILITMKNYYDRSFIIRFIEIVGNNITIKVTAYNRIINNEGLSKLSETLITELDTDKILYNIYGKLGKFINATITE
jgi:hypothetical protein